VTTFSPMQIKEEHSESPKLCNKWLLNFYTASTRKTVLVTASDWTRR